MTYGNISQGQLDVASILHLLDQVLNHIVTEGEGKGLQREGVCRLGRALQVEAGVGYAQNHGCGGWCRFHLEAGSLHRNCQQPKPSGTGLRGSLGVAVVPYSPSSFEWFVRV